jgi:hypothetical protein
VASQKAKYTKNLKQPGRYDGYPAIDQFQLYSFLPYTRPIPQEPSGQPIWYEVFNLNAFIFAVSSFSFVGYTQQEQKNVIFSHDQQLNEISKKYDFKSFMSISNFCSISFSEWLNLSAYAKEALVKDFEEVMNERERERQKKETDQKLQVKEQMQKQQKSSKPTNKGLSIF